MKFIESICFKNHRYHNLEFHTQRWMNTHHHFFHSKPKDLATLLPKIDETGVFKVRITYDESHHEVNFSVYEKKDIQSLALVMSDPIDYSFKFANRSAIEKLHSTIADDIIITIDGLITDSSYANLAFWDGSDWLTPKNPLLAGVKRARLLDQGQIKPQPISINDLPAFEKVSLINAMLDLEELVIPISAIKSAS